MTDIRNLNLSTQHETNYRLVFPYLPFLSTSTTTQKLEPVLLYLKTVTLPQVSMTPTIVESPYIQFKETSKDITYGDLIVTYAVDELLTNYKIVYDWILSMKHPERFGITSKNKVNASLHILSNNKNPKIEIELIDIFPITISELPFTLNSTEARDLEVSVTFSMLYYKVI